MESYRMSHRFRRRFSGRRARPGLGYLRSPAESQIGVNFQSAYISVGKRQSKGERH